MAQVLANAQQALNQAGQQLGPAVQNAGQSVQGLNKVILPILRRVMPQMVAQQIIGAQPMTGPSSSIFALRARYGLTKMFPGCECKERNAFDFDYVVDLTPTRVPEEQSDEILIWVMLHAQSPYNYGLFDVSSDVETHAPSKVWRFTFADPNEAFEFRMRWS